MKVSNGDATHCNDLVHAVGSAPAARGRSIPGSLAGGAIPDGTYALTSVVVDNGYPVFPGAREPKPVGPETLRVHGSTLDEALAPSSGTERRFTARMVIDGAWMWIKPTRAWSADADAGSALRTCQRN